MSEYLIQDSTLTNIANSIRGKTGKSEPILTENMANEIDSIAGGGGENPFKYATRLTNTFDGAVFPEETALTIESDSITTFTNAFARIKGNLTRINFVGNSQGKPLLMNSMLDENKSVKVLDFTRYKAVVMNDTVCFRGAGAIETILGEIDFSQMTEFKPLNGFLSNALIRELRVKAGTIKHTLNVSNMLKASAETLQSIIDGLAQVEVAQTVTFGNLKNKLSVEQTQAISAKNWILA